MLQPNSPILMFDYSTQSPTKLHLNQVLPNTVALSLFLLAGDQHDRKCNLENIHFLLGLQTFPQITTFNLTPRITITRLFSGIALQHQRQRQWQKQNKTGKVNGRNNKLNLMIVLVSKIYVKICNCCLYWKQWRSRSYSNKCWLAGHAMLVWHHETNITISRSLLSTTQTCQVAHNGPQHCEDHQEGAPQQWEEAGGVDGPH